MKLLILFITFVLLSGCASVDFYRSSSQEQATLANVIICQDGYFLEVDGSPIKSQILVKRLALEPGKHSVVVGHSASPKDSKVGYIYWFKKELSLDLPPNKLVKINYNYGNDFVYNSDSSFSVERPVTLSRVEPDPTKSCPTNDLSVRKMGGGFMNGLFEGNF